MRATVVTLVVLVLLVLGACGGPVEAVDQSKASTSVAGLCTPDGDCTAPRLCIRPGRQGWSMFSDLNCKGTEYAVDDHSTPSVTVTWDGRGCLGDPVPFTYRSSRDSSASGGFCWSYDYTGPITYPTPGYPVRR